jgi:hypothetical protein
LLYLLQLFQLFEKIFFLGFFAIFAVQHADREGKACCPLQEGKTETEKRWAGLELSLERVNFSQERELEIFF